MASTWTVISTTAGPMFHDGTSFRQTIAATEYPIGTEARTSESTGVCYEYFDTQFVLGGPGIGVTQAWSRVGLSLLAFVAGTESFMPGASVIV